MSNKLILEIGCGEQKVMDESIGVDIRKTEKVDIIADARQLPFKDGCFDHVYSSHLIEPRFPISNRGYRQVSMVK